MPNLLSTMLSNLSRQVLDGAAHPARIGAPADLAATFASMGITLPETTIAALRRNHEDWVALERAVHESVGTLAVTRATAARAASSARRMRHETAAAPRAWIAACGLLLWAAAGRQCGMLLWWGGLALGTFWISPDLLLDAGYLYTAIVRRANAVLHRREKRRLHALRLCAAEARQIYADTLEQIAQIHPDVAPVRARRPVVSRRAECAGVEI